MKICPVYTAAAAATTLSPHHHKENLKMYTKLCVCVCVLLIIPTATIDSPKGKNAAMNIWCLGCV